MTLFNESEGDATNRAQNRQNQQLVRKRQIIAANRKGNSVYLMALCVQVMYEFMIGLDTRLIQSVLNKGTIAGCHLVGKKIEKRFSIF